MKKKFTNQEIAELLRAVAAVYQLEGKNRFEIIAYENAADSVEQATDSVQQIWADDGEIELPGIGKKIGSYLAELFTTSKVKQWDQFLSQYPEAMFPLLKIAGVGPKTALKLVEMKVKSVVDLEEKLKSGQLVKDGFSQALATKILAAIDETKKRSDRTLLFKAKEIADELIDYLKQLKEVEETEALGSLRRKVVTVGDIDLGVASDQPEKVIEHFLRFKGSRKVEAGNSSATISLHNGIRVDILVCPVDAWGNLLQHFTGAQAHNVHLRKLALQQGYIVSEYGIRKEADRDKKNDNSLTKFKTEKEVYAFFKMDYIEPERREGTGEIELALKHELPKTVELADLKGDLHTHTVYTDAVDTVTAMGDMGRSLGYEYQVLTDHSYPNLNFEKRLEEIGKFNERIRHSGKQGAAGIDSGRGELARETVGEQDFHLLPGLEVNITVGGKLQVPDKILEMHAWNTASIHTGFDQPREEITARLIYALEHPYIEVISHPTGRLINQRSGYQADWVKVFEAAVKNNKTIEIDGYPNRMDLPDNLIREALKYGVKFVINSDAHATEQMKLIEYGIYTAKRGWVTKDMVINTWPWKEFKKYLNRL